MHTVLPKLLPLLLPALILTLKVFSQEDYQITLNDSTFSIALDKPYRLTIRNQSFNFTVKSKELLSYIDSSFSFKYPKEFKVNNVSADKNVDQLMILDASGSGVLIQAYRTMNPVAMTDLLIQELTKENLTYGYDLTRSEYERTVASGQKLKVVKLVQRYKTNVRTYEVAIAGKKDEGIAILTFMMPVNEISKESAIAETVWRTLWIK